MMNRVSRRLTSFFVILSLLVFPQPTLAANWVGTSTGFKYVQCDNGDADVFQMTYYQHSSYNGATVKICWDLDSNGDFQWNTFCTIPMTAPSAGDDLFCGTIFDDSLDNKASSYRIHYLRAGWSIKICQHRDLGGGCYTRTTTGSWVFNEIYNDQMSSMRAWD